LRSASRGARLSLQRGRSLPDRALRHFLNESETETSRAATGTGTCSLAFGHVRAHSAYFQL